MDLQYNVIITRRRTKRLSLRIGRNGELRVSAPYVCTKSRIFSFIESNQEWIEAAITRKAQAQSRKQEIYRQLPLDTPKQKKEAKAKLDAIIAPLIEHYSGLMGESPSGIAYTSAKTRWGSCNIRSRKINFSLYLLLLPVECIEHIVVHELAHLIVPNHSPAFHAIVSQYYPRWKEARVLEKNYNNSYLK